MSAASSSRWMGLTLRDKLSHLTEQLPEVPPDASSRRPGEGLACGDLQEACLEAITAQLGESVDFVRNYAELIYEEHATELPAEAGRQLRLILKACDRAEQLVDWLQAFCRAGKPVPSLTEIELEPLLTELGREVSASCPMLTELSLERPLPRVLGDGESLARLFTILLSLAEDIFRGQKCRAKIFAAEDSSVILRIVSDQAESEAQRGHTTWGSVIERLKLGVAARIIRANRGRLWIRSRSGGEITFRIRLLQKRNELSAGARIRPPHWVATDIECERTTAESTDESAS